MPRPLELVKSSLGQLANSGEKAKAYDHLTRLALQKFDKENAIQAANMSAQITKQKVEPYDTLASIRQLMMLPRMLWSASSMTQSQ